MKRICFLLTSILLVLIFFIKPVFAQDLIVNCDVGTCISSGLKPLFSNADIWYPGQIIMRQVQITNNSSVSQKFGTNELKVSTSGDLDKILDLSITRASDSFVVWTGSVEQFYSAGEISLGTYSAGESDKYNYIISMPTSVGNEYQDQSTIFDLKFGFIANPVVSGDSLINVLGAKTERKTDITKSSGKKSQILGETIQVCKERFLLLILLISFIIQFFYDFLVKKVKMKLFLLGNIIISLITYLIFLLVNQNFINLWYFFPYIKTANFFCTYFLLFDLLIIVVVKTLFILIKKSSYVV